MKCVLLVASDQITRLNNEFAIRLVRRGEAHYIPKAEWKTAGRPTNKVKALKKEPVIQSPEHNAPEPQAKSGWIGSVNYWPLDHPSVAKK